MCIVGTYSILVYLHNKCKREKFPLFIISGIKCVYKHTFCVVPLWMFLNWKIIYYSKKKIVFFIGDFHFIHFWIVLNQHFFSFVFFSCYKVSILSMLQPCNRLFHSVTFCHFIQLLECWFFFSPSLN